MIDRPATNKELSSLMVESTAATLTAGLCYAATTTASKVSASSCSPDIMNSSASSSTEVAQTMSPLAGPSSDVDIPDRSWPTIPTPVSVWPYPKTPMRKETKRRRMSGKSQI